MSSTVHFLDVDQLQQALLSLWAHDTGRPFEGTPPDEELRRGIKGILEKMNNERRRNFLADFIRHQLLFGHVEGVRRSMGDIASFAVWLENQLGVKVS